jgi:hypothetical protein
VPSAATAAIDAVRRLAVELWLFIALESAPSEM